MAPTPSQDPPIPQGGGGLMGYDHDHGRGGGGGTRNLEHICKYVYRVYIHIHTCTYIYIHVPESRNKTHHFRCITKMPTTNSSPSSALAIKKKHKKKHEKRTQSLFGIRQVFPMRQVSWAKVSGCFEFHQLIIAAFSLPKGSKVKHSWVLYTLQWGFGVANNKWLWNGPHAVIFFHNHFHTNLQMKLSRSHEMHSSGWELTHTPPHVTF